VHPRADSEASLVGPAHPRTATLLHDVFVVSKIVDVQQAISLTAEQVIARELAFIKVTGTNEHFSAIIEVGKHYGATVANTAPDAITLEVVGSAETIDKLISQLQPYGIHEIARSGSIAIARGV